MEIMNGFSCQNCTDVAKAQKGIDPTAGSDAQPGETSYAGKWVTGGRSGGVE